MARKSKLLDDEVENLAITALKKIGKSGLVGRKLQVILAAKKHGITKTAEFYSITKKSIITWIKELKEKSVTALEVGVGRGRKFLLNQDQELEVKKWIEENCNITIRHLRLLIIDRMGICLAPATVHRLMQRLRFSYITPRPKHYKQNEKLKTEFKKKSQGDYSKQSR
jgi:transposase